jgi:Protein of unknown function (DUF1257)
MSHFTRLKTQIKDTDSLTRALADVGFTTIEVHSTPQPLYGYQGDIRSDAAEVIIRRCYIGALSNDIGFKRRSDGSFEAVISEYDRARYSSQWLDRLTQRYAYHALVAKAPVEGFTIETEETLEDGTIRVVLARWA